MYDPRKRMNAMRQAMENTIPDVETPNYTCAQEFCSEVKCDSRKLLNF